MVFWTWPVLEIDFRNYKSDSDTRRWQVLGQSLHPSCDVFEICHKFVPETSVKQDCTLNGREY